MKFNFDQTINLEKNAYMVGAGLASYIVQLDCGIVKKTFS
jgi:hypothetical protein